MNLYLRLLWLILRMLRGVPRRGLFDESRVAFRVWPTDCDLNLHMNNGRYLTFMDLGRTHLMAQAGMLCEFLRRRWLPVLGAAEITFIRPLPPFAKFELVTRVVTWDEKYVYLEQTFERDGRLCAHAYVKGLFLQRGVKVPNVDVVRVVGYTGDAPPLPEVLQRWAELAATKRGNYEKTN
ncbi:MAG: thioesterase family protein [Burkholderiales bacterium]